MRCCGQNAVCVGIWTTSVAEWRELAVDKNVCPPSVAMGANALGKLTPDPVDVKHNAFLSVTATGADARLSVTATGADARRPEGPEYGHDPAPHHHQHLTRFCPETACHYLLVSSRTRGMAYGEHSCNVVGVNVKVLHIESSCCMQQQ